MFNFGFTLSVLQHYVQISTLYLSLEWCWRSVLWVGIAVLFLFVSILRSHQHTSVPLSGPCSSPVSPSQTTRPAPFVTDHVARFTKHWDRKIKMDLPTKTQMCWSSKHETVAEHQTRRYQIPDIDYNSFTASSSTKKYGVAEEHWAVL